MTDDLSTKLAALTEARPEPTDPAVPIRLRIKRRRLRRSGTAAVLVTAAATAAVLVVGPMLGSIRAGGVEPGVAGPVLNGPANLPGPGPRTPSVSPSKPPAEADHKLILPSPWSAEVFTKMPDANAYRPKAYYIARGEVSTESWSVLAFSDNGASAGCLVAYEGPANSFGRPYQCFDEWPKGRRSDFLATQGSVKEKNTPKIDAVMVMGAVSVDARTVQVRTTAGQVYTANAVATPVSEHLRFFAVVIPKKNAKVASIRPLDATGQLANAPTGLPATGGPCVVRPANCATAQPSG
jgi:hypothetical protein